MEYLQQNVKPSIKNDLKFDSNTVDQIRFFFSYLRNINAGIPQMDNGITSDFVGYLYLILGDLLIHNLLRTSAHASRITDYKIARYVDDIYIFVGFKNGIAAKERDTITLNIGSQIADLFSRELGLKCNEKTGYYRLCRQHEKDELRQHLKRVSPDEIVSDEDDVRSAPERANALITELNMLKTSELDTNLRYSRNDHQIAIETLKDVFTESVDNILNTKEYTEKLLEIFTDFNFDLVCVHASSTMAVIHRSALLNVVQNFHGYLLQKVELTYKEIDLILRSLAYEDFDNKQLLRKLKQVPYMEQIIKIFERPILQPSQTGYFDITKGRIKKLAKMDSVIHQIRLRRMAETKQSYSEALNHLLNEIHSICYELHCKSDFSMTKPIKNYQSDDVASFLQSKQVPNGIVIQIRNLFDRRNLNTMSHPGSATHSASDVTRDDYFAYRKYVGDCLAHILK